MADVDAIAARLEKAHDIIVAGQRLEGESRQKQGSPDRVTPYIEPPLPLDQLAALSKTSAVRRSIVDAIARNTVGLGFSVDVAEGHEQEVNDPREQAHELETLLEAVAARDTILDQPSFSELMIAVKTDEEEVGNGFLEVSRNRLTGKIDGLFHVPAKRVRRKKDRKGWALVKADFQDEAETEFYNFGDKVHYTSNGQPSRVLKKGKIWHRNELISFRIYSSESRDYGLPRDVGMLLEYAGDKLASEYNVSFFDAGGTPPTVLFVHGEPDTDGAGRVNFRVPQRTVDRVAQTIKSDGGHRDRVAIIPLPSGSRTELHQLGQISERDMGFVNFRNDNRERALSAFRVSPVFIAAEGEGRYDAEVQRAITLEQVFDPEQSRYESRLNRTLINDLGFPFMALKFKRLAVENDKSRRESATRLAEAGVITVRELREAHGRGPLPEANEGQEPEAGQVPDGFNDTLVNLKQPRGAENRTYDEQDQRGLKPGLAGREQQSTDNELEQQRRKTFEKSMDTLERMSEQMNDGLLRAAEVLSKAIPPVNVEVPVTIEKNSGRKTVKRDEWGLITEVVEAE